MHFNPYEAQMMREERVKDALRKMGQKQLERGVNSARPRLLNRALASVGGLLLSAGKTLQERHAPVQARLTSSPSPTNQ